MKFRYFVPLILYILQAIFFAVVFMPPDPFAITGFASLLFGFAITYISCVRETLRNSHAVLRLKEKTPLVMPFAMFSIPTLLFGFLMTHKAPPLLKGFLFAYFSGAFAYACGAFLLVRDLILNDRRTRTTKRGLDTPGTRKLILVNPINTARAGLTLSPSSRFPPLGLGIIAALTPDRYRVVLKDEVMEPFIFEEADLVGITAFTSSIDRAYEIAALYRQKGIPVVMGGIHASMRPEEALQFADCVVVGEAEGVWGDLIKDFEAGAMKRLYRGERKELCGLPVARRNLFSPDYLFATIQTSRGCPMDCPFCSVTAFNGKTYRQRPVAEVLDEIAGIPQTFLFFVDDNILGHGRAAEERAVALFKGMTEKKLGKSWFCQASLNFASNDEVLYWAAKAGCKMVFLGLEATDRRELEMMEKKLNIRTDYRTAFRRIHKYGIAVLGAFIFGTDSETRESMEGKTRFLLKERIDVMQTTILTPLPGTRLFETYMKEGRLLCEPSPRNWMRFDMSELTFELKGMDSALFHETLEKCRRKLYSLRSLARKFLQTFVSTGRMEAAFWALNSNKAYRAASMGRGYGECRFNRL